ncbi:pyruvate,water dikinase [Methylohalomonas lacus]|uniref:Phosphoenolpyruvate synthase n=1 Tax=Methylohalomonas lacus TaxID=398773 RepID=A0AAE3L545_9GAMM|nr:phosphoenolpyruvate synthase [Methylohalomonas lacus]MCS3902652.1 pyruvate,water dikinase [Methylohalomonas lacus]
MTAEGQSILWLDQVGNDDVARVGGKNASLGEMIANLGDQGVNVPPGFATSVSAYWDFVAANGLKKVIEDARAAVSDGTSTPKQASETIRDAFIRAEWPAETAKAIREAYRQLCEKTGHDEASVAVRSSATAEDLPDASFAGQQETFLNIRGEDAVLDACKRCYGSLFGERAISYRESRGFDDLQVALSVGVQMMVRSDLGGAGVMFSIDTETGFDQVVLITAVWGLGESLVQGSANPDEYQVFKPLLDNKTLQPIITRSLGGKAEKMIYADKGETTVETIATTEHERGHYVLDSDEVLQLARWACVIEQHYGMPMDMEWARDGETGELYIVQARPETVQSQAAQNAFKLYEMKEPGKKLIKGLSIGSAIVSGDVCRLDSPDQIDDFVEGSILVTGNTDPDWMPIMQKAAAIITDQGGRTSHAAIVSRELGLPAVVGAGRATDQLNNGQTVTVSCAEGDEGFIYEGALDYEVRDIQLDDIPETETRVMLNLANPASALRWWRLPADGVGLARMEFVINDHIQLHPMALLKFDELEDEAAKKRIEELTRGYADRTEYFVEQLSLGLARIAAVRYPNPVIVRMSDFKTNEYANLIGGRAFEPEEENPMLGFRGASRYYSPLYRDAFALECQAIRRLREVMGFDNVRIMIPFCRTPAEADQVLDVLADNGLKRGDNGLEIYVMCEVPSNVILAREFAQRFDGFSIGSNDLTQLTLGVDRDSGPLAHLFDEQNDAVKWMLEKVISSARETGTKTGLCGQGPSDYPAFAGFLVDIGIDSISVTPDSFIAVKQHVAAAEKKRR